MGTPETSRWAGLAARHGGAPRLAVLVAVLIVGVGLRVGYAIDGGDYQPPDSRAYAQIAENLYEHGSFDARDSGRDREIQPNSTYSPGLPLSVAAFYSLTGGVHLTLARVALALVSGLAILMAYFLGRRLAGLTAGLIAAAALAIYPAVIEYQALLLTEPLASFLLASGLLLYFKALENRRFWLSAAAGAVLGALVLVRPEYLLPAVALPALALLWRGRSSFRERPLRAGVMVVATLVVVLPWTARNYVVLDRVVPVSTGNGKALFVGTYLPADGDGIKLRELLLAERPQLRERLAQRGAIDDPTRLVLERLLGRAAAAEDPRAESDVVLARLGWENLTHAVRTHPTDLAGMLGSKAFTTWVKPARITMEQPQFRALQLGLLVLAIVGLAMLARQRRLEAVVLGLLVLYVTSVGALLIDSPRRALVALPLLAALAGVGAVRLWPLAERRWRALMNRPDAIPELAQPQEPN
jgi:4-amino-4-deoxy-L-arabinose transferase-like glycosyltransferase